MERAEFAEIFAKATVLNFALLTFWLICFIRHREWGYRWHSRWFLDLSKRSYDRIHYGGMMLYEIMIIIFCLTPALVLR
ncbi:DUF6868 family protein [Prochlorococcus marinus]|uniref:DUF6868 family protein n=1 Tax=Prochlorococcus TaxID=1218 RepID=UPI0007B38812|nr:hypothetical protein [Prochlorococcus marinus]KZR75724.1 hypothetical protein PMIT1323_02019 [Prochlorococcus marinus str. MIT 1323]